MTTLDGIRDIPNCLNCRVHTWLKVLVPSLGLIEALLPAPQPPIREFGQQLRAARFAELDQGSLLILPGKRPNSESGIQAGFRDDKFCP